MMLQILEKVFLPWIYRPFHLASFWLNEAHYYFIEASPMGLEKFDLIREWMEKLKVVQLYLFVGHPDPLKEILTLDGMVLQNCQAYEQVIKVVSPK